MIKLYEKQAKRSNSIKTRKRELEKFNECIDRARMEGYEISFAKSVSAKGTKFYTGKATSWVVYIIIPVSILLFAVLF
jgi:hypothetical protein